MPEPPKPKAGQVWRAGRHFIRIDEVRLRNTEDAYVNRVRVTGPAGKFVVKPTPAAPFAHFLTKTRLIKGVMPPPYEYVGEASENHEAAARTEPAAAAPAEPKPAKPVTVDPSLVPQNETKEERRKRQKREAAIRFREKHKKEKP